MGPSVRAIRRVERPTNDPLSDQGGWINLGSRMIELMDELFVSSPALARLRWLLDGLSGRWDENTDAGTVLAPDYAAIVAPSRFTKVMRQRAAFMAPIVVVGIDSEGEEATARFDSRDGDRWVARVTVEPESPHRILTGYAQPWVPDYLTPALPAEFTTADLLSSATAGSQTLVVFGGVPGSGKSAVAEQVGAALDASVFSVDWMMGAMSPFGMNHRTDLMSVGVELLTTLAFRELVAGRSAIIDTPSEDVAGRVRLQSLATAAGATFMAVVCVCSDPALHRQRVEGRQRGIPGWADAGEWSNVTSRLADFPPWPGSARVDTALPLRTCVAQVLEALSARRADQASSTPSRRVSATPDARLGTER